MVQFASVIAVSSAATVAHPLAQWALTTPQGFQHHLLSEDAWMNLAVPLSGVTEPAQGKKGFLHTVATKVFQL